MSVFTRFSQLSRPSQTEDGRGIASWKLDYSSREGKKWMVKITFIDGGVKTIHFGDSTMEDYTQHHDAVRRQRFHQRFASLIEKTKNNPLSPMYYSAKLLW